MNTRTEEKYLCPKVYSEIMQSKLKLFMDCEDYTVQTLYFDDNSNSAYYDKEEGINNRKKFRIRTYSNSSEIFLEKKEKINFISNKKRTAITKEIFNGILCNEITPKDINSNDNLLLEFYSKIKLNLLRPKVIVTYERTAYQDKINKCRITFDKNLRKSNNYKDFFYFHNDMQTFLSDYAIIEIKRNKPLPIHIQDIIQSNNIRKASYSKYYYSRKNEIERGINEF